MMKKLLATTAVLALGAAASADISAYLVGPTAVTLTAGSAEYYDVYVSVTNGDDWTVAGMRATTDTDFYQDAMNDGNPPNPAFFGFVPDSEFTSFYTSPADWPNAGYDGAIVGIAAMNDGPGVLDADYFDTVNTGDGDFMVARITILNGGTLAGEFLYASVNNPTLQTLILPEPASLALLVLGGLVVARRR